MEEDGKYFTLSCLSSFEDLEGITNREGLQWGPTSMRYAILQTLRKLGTYNAQKVTKKRKCVNGTSLISLPKQCRRTKPNNSHCRLIIWVYCIGY